MYPKSYFDASDAKPNACKCFVIMPYAPKFDEVYDAIEEAVTGPPLEFVCERTKDLAGGGMIIEDILKGISESEIIIADLTGLNPNVFYELGIAHMVKNVEKVLLISQNIDDLPFDLNQLRCIPYTQSMAGGRKLKSDLIDAIEAVADVLVKVADDGARVYTFRMQEDQRFMFPHRLMGAGNFLYGFELYADYIGQDGAKLSMQMTRYPAGGAPKQLPRKGFGFPVGQIEPVEEIQRILELEKISGNVATFKLAPQPES